MDTFQNKEIVRVKACKDASSQTVLSGNVVLASSRNVVEYVHRHQHFHIHEQRGAFNLSRGTSQSHQSQHVSKAE